jgi:hypothetical protein
MAYLSFIKTRALTASVVNFTSDATFCQLITGIVSSMTTMNNNVVALQSQINGFQDTYQSKIDKDDCSGFLSDKFQSSETIEMKLVPGGTAGCQKIEFNIKGDNNSTPSIGFDPCETSWTSIPNYEILDPYKFLPGTGTPSQSWQGDVKFSINKIGQVGLKGKCFIIGSFFGFQKSVPLGGGIASNISQKVFTLPSNACLDGKLDNTNDYYGLNTIAVSKITPSGGGVVGGTIGLNLFRVGREIWVQMDRINITPGTTYFDFELQFGGLKALN